MSNSDLIISEILEILAYQYDQDVNKFVTKQFIVKELNLEDNEADVYISRLEGRSWVEVERDISGWEAKITPLGYDQYEQLLEKLDEKDNTKIRYKFPTDEKFSEEIYRIRTYYQALIQLIEAYFSGDVVTTSTTINNHYLKLCIKIEEILNNPDFSVLGGNDWKPFENLLSLDPDAPDVDWEYGKRQLCNNFLSEIEKLFIRHGEKKLGLTKDDTVYLNSFQQFLSKYSEERKEHDKQVLDTINKNTSKYLISKQDPKEELKRYVEKLQEFKRSNGKSNPYDILHSLRTYIMRLDMDNETNDRLLINMEYLHTQSRTAHFWLLDHETLSEKHLRVLNETYDILIIYLKEIVERDIPISLKIYRSQVNKNTKATNFFTKILRRNLKKYKDDEKTSKPHDFFICHATEDKEIVARPLAQKLDELGFDVWYDDFSLRWGSKLMKTITKGIKESKFGIVILSPQFFEKKWAQLELDALVELLNLDDGELLPLLYDLTHEQAKERLPLLSGILYRSWDEGLDQLVLELKDIANGKISDFRKTNTVKVKSISKTDSNEFDLTLDKFTENGNHHVGIRNHKGKTIKSCSILCGNEKCRWWNEDNTYPRHIPEGGAMNVMIPRGFANTNPIIKVISGDEVIEEMRLSKIVHRPATKWNAKDENNEEVERLNTALNRIRSNLATLQNLYQTFLNYPKSVPINDEMEMNISQKNELVENTQTTVNQASYLLEMDWINALNDLCSLAKKNPWFLGEKHRLQVMQRESCPGIISQIEGLLKHLPNPPV